MGNSFSITVTYGHIYKTQKVMNGGVRNDTIRSIKKYSFIQLTALIFLYCTFIWILSGGTWNIL